MEQISAYVKTIITIVIVFSFISLLLPKGDMKKYVRFAIGLILIGCFIVPLANFKGFTVDNLHFAEQQEYTDQVYVNQIKAIYTAKLEEEVKRRFGVEKVKITVGEDMQIQKVETSDPEKKQKIEKYLGVE